MFSVSKNNLFDMVCFFTDEDVDETLDGTLLRDGKFLACRALIRELS